MRFSEFARALEALENTASRLQMYELLDGLFDSADGEYWTVTRLGTWDDLHIQMTNLGGGTVERMKPTLTGLPQPMPRVMRPLETDTYSYWKC
jgi:hypothetical protein